MKRLICFLLVISLAAGLCACSSANPSATSDAKEQSAEEAIDNTAEAPEESTDAEESPDPVVVEVPIVVEEDPEEEPLEKPSEEADEPFTFGTVEDGVYENELLGYGFHMDGWTFGDDEKIASLNQWDPEDMETDLQALIRENTNIFVMYTESENGLQNVNIQLQDISSLSGAEVDIDKIIDYALPVVLSSVEENGYENTEVQKITLMIGSDEYSGISVFGEYMGLPVYQKEAIFRCSKNYIAFVTASSVLEDSTDDILAAFYRLTAEE